MSPAAKVKDPRSILVDAYIEKSQPFSQPILWHVRELVHKAVPGVEETIKWSRPFFMYRGIILGNMSAFKAHCSLGLWGQEIAAQVRADGAASSEAMGTFGRLGSVKDLPDDKKLMAYLKKAAAAIDEGTRTKSIERPAQRVAKAEVEVPAELVAALKKNKAAQKAFDGFAPTHRREYIEWVRARRGTRLAPSE